MTELESVIVIRGEPIIAVRVKQQPLQDSCLLS